MTEDENSGGGRTKPARPKAPARSVAEQARDLMRDRFRARDYDALMALLQREDAIVLLSLQQAMDKLEDHEVPA